MKISKSLILLCSFLFCILTVNSDKINKDDKIKLQIELLNKDELLSSPHLKIKKSIVHNGKKINIKLFERINENVLERAYIIEEVDKAKSLTDEEKQELLSLNTENTDEDEKDDGKMKVVSTEESKENDIHMIRKIYKETKGNKEITYCYLIFKFNSDLEKMNEVSRSELFKSLDTMPDYLSFLSPKEKISDTENLLEEEYEQSANDSLNKSSLGGVAAVEISDDSDNMKVNITNYIRTLDSIINYIISKSDDSTDLPKFYKELVNEREYLYKLSLEKTDNEDIINGQYWKNKSKIEKYILYEALTKLSTLYFTDMMKDTDSIESENSEYNKFMNLIEKSLECHSVLDNTEILDIVILHKLNDSEEHTDKQNKVDKELVQKCLSLYKLLLSKNENLTVNNNGKSVANNNEDEIKHELSELNEESFPVDKYMIRKEDSDTNDFLKNIEGDNKTNSDEDDVDYEDDDSEEDYEDDDSEEDYEDNDSEEDYEDDDAEEYSDEYENENNNSFLENDDEVITDDISTEMFNEDREIAKETEEEHRNEILDVLHLEEQKILDGEINGPIEKDIKSHNAMSSSSYLESSSLVEDDDDEDDDVDTVEDDDDDMFSLNDDDDDDDIFSDSEDEDVLVDNDEEEDEYDVDDDVDDDVDVDDDDEEDIDTDEDSLDLEDDDNEDEGDKKEKFSDKIKKTLKKEFKNVLESGKEMGKNALNSLVDKAEDQVKKLTTKMSSKLKNTFKGNKNKKGSKKSKNNKEVKGKAIKKGSSKENKKVEKNNKKTKASKKSAKGSSKSVSTQKTKDKKKKSSKSTKDKKGKKLRKSDKKGVFINLSTELSKLAPSKKMNVLLREMTDEMKSLKSKKNKLMKDLEKPKISDEKLIDDFEKYDEKMENKKNKHIRKSKSDMNNCE